MEKDLGTGGTEGALEEAGCDGGAFEDVNRLLNGLFDFLVRRRDLGGSPESFLEKSLAGPSSGMLEVVVEVGRLSVSPMSEAFPGSSTSMAVCLSLAFSFVGELDREFGDIHDFLLSLDNERAGERDGDASSFLVDSRRLLAGFRSSEGSRLLDENGKNLDARREFEGLNSGSCSLGPFSDVGLESPDDEVEPCPSTASGFSSSSEIVPLSSSKVVSSRSLTRGKYV